MTADEEIDKDVIVDLFNTLNKMGFGEAQWIAGKSENNIFTTLYLDREWWEGYKIRMYVTPQKFLCG